MTQPRRDWRDTVRAATDLALLGLVVALAALPVVTAGAAVAAGSAALHHHLAYDRWPGARFCLAVLRRRLLSGLLATAGCAVAVALLVVDVLAVRSGAVPGGPVLIVLTLAVAAVGAGYAGLAVVAAGAADCDRFAEPGRFGAAPVPALAPGATRRPAAVASAAGVLAVAAVLVLLVHPVLSPVLAGYTLFALHVLARRPARLEPAAPTALTSPARPPEAGPYPVLARAGERDRTVA